MSDNPVKREEARRVWRLNKKEGVPVLEALETADISKDTYYEYKAEYESEWEGQIVTAEEVERELERLRGEVSDLAERAAEIDGEFSEIEESFEEIEEQVAAERTAARLWDRLEEIEWRVQRVDEQEEEAYTGRDREVLDLEKMREQLTTVIEKQRELEELASRGVKESRVSKLEGRVERLQEELEKRPTTLYELLFPGG